MIVMLYFSYTCYVTKTLPEPFFNAGVLSVIFPAITLPGDTAFIIGIRYYCLSLGILLFLILAPIEVYRTTVYRGKPMVAKEASVVMLQSGAASICSAWQVSSLTGV